MTPDKDYAPTPHGVGDYFEIKGVQPTWATNPLTTIYGGYVVIEE